MDSRTYVYKVIYQRDMYQRVKQIIVKTKHPNMDGTIKSAAFLWLVNVPYNQINVIKP